MVIENSIEVMVVSSQLGLTDGNTLRVTVTFKALQPAFPSVVREMWVSLVVDPSRDYTIKTPVTITRSTTPVPYTEVVDMPIISGVGLKATTYALWVEFPEDNLVVKVPYAVTLTGEFGAPPGEYVLVKNYDYPAASTYTGDATEATAEVNVALTQVPLIGGWLENQVVNNFANEVAAQGHQMLRITVYERDHGILSKDLKIIATATGKGVATPQELGAQAVPVVLIVWAVIFVAALAILLITVLVPSVRNITWGGGGIIGIFEMLPLLIMVMVMSMMMEAMGPMIAPAGTPAQPKPVTEAVVKGVKKAAEFTGKAVKRVTEYYKEKRAKEKEKDYESESED